MEIDYRWPLSMSLLAALAIACPATGQAQSGAQSQPAPAPQPAAQQNSDSVADAARKAKAASSANAQDSSAQKKVYTNEDLRGMDRSDVSVVGSGKAPAKTGQTASNGPKDEQYWRNRMQKLRDEMAQVDRQIAQIESANQDQHAAAGGSNGSNPPPPPPSAYTVTAHARGGNTPQLEKLKERKAQIQQQIDQLEEEARKANVPPGWLR